ncbi:MAG: hypothetical protein ACFFAT_13405 [Promethearchaeota archaeon]
MSIRTEDLKDIGKFKQNTKNAHKCPICKKKIDIGIEFDIINKMVRKDKGIYTHLIIHGNPLHGMICYIDVHMTVRSVSAIESIEISRDSETFKQFMKKWANPY